MDPEQSPGDQSKSGAFEGAHETTEALMRQIAEANGLDLDAQKQPPQDEPELAEYVRQARMELEGKSQDEVILLNAGETAQAFTDHKLADEVYVSLTEAHGARGQIAEGINAINQISDYVSRLEALSSLARTTNNEYVKSQLVEAAGNTSHQDIDINRAKEVYYRHLTEDRDLEKADTFAKLVGDAAVNAPNYAKARTKETNVRQQAQLMTRIGPDTPQPSLRAQAKELAAEARRTTGLKLLDQFHAQIQSQPPGPDHEKMLARHALATLELANDSLRPGQAAA